MTNEIPWNYFVFHFDLFMICLNILLLMKGVHSHITKGFSYWTVCLLIISILFIILWFKTANVDYRKLQNETPNTVPVAWHWSTHDACMYGFCPTYQQYSFNG